VFHYVLQCLRNGAIAADKLTANERELLAHELDHYCIDWIQLAPPPPPPPPPPSKLAFTAGASEIITSEAEKETLCRILESVTKQPKLTLLHTAAQGADFASFKAKVAGKGSLLVVVQSTAGHKFGGFVFDQFESFQGDFKKGNAANFLFALGNITGTPLKLLRLPDSTQGVGACCGFHMGSGQGFGQDFDAFWGTDDPRAVGNTYTIAAPGFAAVTVTKGTLCGTPGSGYSPAKQEVFQVQ
jgi:hypothetical protein